MDEHQEKRLRQIHEELRSMGIFHIFLVFSDTADEMWVANSLTLEELEPISDYLAQMEEELINAEDDVFTIKIPEINVDVNIQDIFLNHRN